MIFFFFFLVYGHTSELSRWLSGEESACQRKIQEFDLWVGKIPLGLTVQYIWVRNRVTAVFPPLPHWIAREARPTGVSGSVHPQRWDAAEQRAFVKGGMSDWKSEISWEAQRGAVSFLGRRHGFWSSVIPGTIKYHPSTPSSVITSKLCTPREPGCLEFQQRRFIV